MFTDIINTNKSAPGRIINALEAARSYVNEKLEAAADRVFDIIDNVVDFVYSVPRFFRDLNAQINSVCDSRFQAIRIWVGLPFFLLALGLAFVIAVPTVGYKAARYWLNEAI